ncbi:hypothetical protein B0I72DRAFT_140904 [Yarrowia lipolytica]|uniref:Uncharacterized protein n=1 Tax=Yarrowia lipolytica TaxID=4952 RepID=A0A371C738_YARLL|nr:hypothetical protein BKA91DRAFT_132352 [Yarrowia lipolytica]KAE8171789.1 hypothetical protein BKA90DRAFT_138478 [Yarrowia lipolytica]RDW26127.1 hypothetical protein B0I71DRAFT_131448 [Yarrowia lipolytica]RDW30796.1 hypothetical protein B0I72DRAFT_140904 [Yarrowia lipolytica]RDW38630.1 hypothetical protein B0I73DRAFT_133398 [Yarrowia lipolytica]
MMICFLRSPPNLIACLYLQIHTCYSKAADTVKCQNVKSYVYCSSAYTLCLWSLSNEWGSVRVFFLFSCFLFRRGFSSEFFVGVFYLLSVEVFFFLFLFFAVFLSFFFFHMQIRRH